MKDRGNHILIFEMGSRTGLAAHVRAGLETGQTTQIGTGTFYDSKGAGSFRTRNNIKKIIYENIL